MKTAMVDSAAGFGSRTAGTRTLIIGIGNPWRSDDGAGHAVVQRLREQVPGGVDCRCLSGEASELIGAWADADQVTVVDASSSSQPPGSVRCFDGRSRNLPLLSHASSSHGFGLIEAIGLAREINRLPPVLTIIAIEGERFDHGESLSGPVADAVDRVAMELTGRYGNAIG